MVFRLSKRSIISIFVIMIAVLALFCELAVTLQHLPEAPLAVGITAPHFQLDSFSGKEVSLEQLKGRPVVVMFWSGLRWPDRWFPKLEQISKEFTKDQVVVLMVSIFPNSNQLLYFWSERSIPLLYDEDAKTSRSYHAYNRPVVYLIDKEGKVHRSWVRDSSELEDDLKESIHEILKPKTDLNEPDPSQEQ